MDSRLTLPINTVLDDSYRIVRVVGSGGFGITYEAEDIKLHMRVALKEYYPLEFGDRDSTMSVKPKSDRHRQTFQWGRSNFLQEARTLARFEHPSIVRVTRVFEANSTAYMVMRFEQGQSLEDWLSGLGRSPTQEELDRIVAPILDALQMLHAENFLHRDIAPDNIVVRADGTPVLLDFGAARRAVAEMSHTLTGIVKAGYSPHEQYSVDGRLQGPWSDIYALGGTLYRAVTGKTPEEAALRVDEDHMPAAARAAKGHFRPEFLSAIDACLKVRHAERPRSVAQLRPMLLAQRPQLKGEPEPLKTRKPTSRSPHERKVSGQLSGKVSGQVSGKVSGQVSGKVSGKVSGLAPRPRPAHRWPAVAAGALALLGGAYGGIEYMRWQPTTPGATSVNTADLSHAARQQAELDAERRQQDAAAAATKRQAELEEDRRRQDEAAAAAQRQAELEAERRREDEAQRQAELEAERQRKADEERVAAAEAARQQEEERARVASATLNAQERATFVRQVQQLLKQGGCYDGAMNGRAADTTQDALDEFVAKAANKGKAKPARIELAKATAGDFEAWLRDASQVKGEVCTPAAPPKPKVVRPTREREEPAQRRRVDRPVAEPREREPSSSGTKLCWGPRNEYSAAACR
ncbi:MAG: serine/threonine protein kinase [Hyphomicrobiaceae bacterium]|nr:serine/threonine protein kinase [Hyphomicrobiaceae bacterium]